MTLDAGSAEDFVRGATMVAGVPLVPELQFHLASEITPLWQATEDTLGQIGLPPPFWAFCWAGGQALARYVLDHPETVRGRTVLDFAAGCGVAGLAAARAGALSVTAAEVDSYAATALRLNAALNGLCLEVHLGDLIDAPAPRWDVVLAGDICYEKAFSEQALAWLRRLAGQGALVLLGDPGRAFRPREGLHHLAAFDVPTTRELEDRDVRHTDVWRLVGEGACQMHSEPLYSGQPSQG